MAFKSKIFAMMENKGFQNTFFLINLVSNQGYEISKLSPCYWTFFNTAWGRLDVKPCTTTEKKLHKVINKFDNMLIRFVLENHGPFYLLAWLKMTSDQSENEQG